jgi:formate dehydrogenase subunit gamma
MDEPINRLTEDNPDSRGDIQRFDSAERLIHWTTALLMILCIGSIVAIQIPSAMVFFGGRTILRIAHILTGILLPVPLWLGLVLSKNSKCLKKDLYSLGHFTKEDFKWIRYWGNNKTLKLKKFNGGQKANYSFISGSVVVMIITGLVMQSFNLLPLNLRIGATFTHKLFAILIVIVLIGHIFYAVGNPESLKSMITLKVSKKWATIHCKDWVVESEDDDMISD